MKKNPRGVYEKIPGSNIWWINYYDSEGRRHREAAGSKSAAISLYRKRKTEVLEGKKFPIMPRAVVKFKELADMALEYSRVHKESWEDDVIRMKFIVEEFGDRPAHSIKPEEIHRWLASRTQIVKGKEQALAAATLNRYRSLLSLTFRLAIQNGKLESNPIKAVKRRKENNERVRYLTDEEEKRLRAMLRREYPHRIPEFELALNTGMRKGEQYKWIARHTIDFKTRVLTILKSKHGMKRHVPVNDVAVKALKLVLKHGQGDDPLFLSRDGGAEVNPRGWFERSVKLAKIKDFRWHDLRHTFASRLVMAGVPLRTVQELMGHKTIQVTCRYAHLAPQHTLEAVQRLCMTSRLSHPQGKSQG